MAGEPGKNVIAAATQAPGRAARRPRAVAVLWLWARPGSAARELAGLRLWQAWGIHGLAWLAVFVVFTLFIDAMEDRSGGQTLGEVLGILVDGRIVDPEVAMTIVAVVASLEIGHVLLADLITPWGAADEPLRCSFAHALRFTWLHSIHVALVVVLGCALTAWLEQVRADHDRRQAAMLPALPAFPGPQPGPDATAEQRRQHEASLAEWEAAIDERNRAQEALSRQRPLLVRYGLLLTTWSWNAGALWLMFTLLRAAGTPRGVTPVERPPTCEFCGYNLTATPLEGRCPECGEPAARSLGPDVRRGTHWEHRREPGAGRAYRRTAAQAVFAPDSLGRAIRVATASSAWQSFFPLHLPAVLLLAWAAFVACFIIDTGKSPLTAEEGMIMWAIGPGFGTLGIAAVAGLQLLAANAVGWGLSWLNRRNLLPAAMQAAAYLGGYALAATAFGSLAATAFFFIAEHRLIEPLTRALRFDASEALTAAWFVLMGAWLCGGVYLTWRIAAAARFANR